MVKGTPSMGKKRRKGRLHIRCRRCGETSYHKIKGVCSHCGYGKSKKLRKYKWQKKHHLKKLNNTKGLRKRNK